MASVGVRTTASVATEFLIAEQWRTEGGFWGFKSPEIPKLGQIPRSVENKSVTT
jgi:hypothetical protein